MSHGRAARLLFQLPRDCRVFIALQPANQWGWSEVLQNKIAYLLEVLVWQNSKDAQKKSPSHRPKPFVPDFIKQAQPKSAIVKDAVAYDIDTLKDFLERPRH